MATNEATPTLRDLDRARAKYREERDRRLRRDGEDQYLDVQADFKDFAADPFAPADFTREPVRRDHDVIIVGAGFGGLMMAVRLSEVGVDDVALIDEAADVGGTWYWNRYPGAQCDIESYCYLPLLEETGYVPEDKYSYQPEIFAHAQRIATQYGLYDNALFQTSVTEMRWDDEAARWHLATQHGDQLTARHVVLALGPGSKPKLPRVPGISTFEGRMFHTSRWDFSYTGGSTAGGLTGLADKRVGFIGTGSTGIGTMPYLAADAAELILFQRTPAIVLGRNNQKTDLEWAKSLEPGWQRVRRYNLEDSLLGRRTDEDLVQDGWTTFFPNLQPTTVTDEEYADLPPAIRAELADLRELNRVRARVDQEVEDPQVAELLKPWYRARCKRPTFSDDYLPMFNRANVRIVDVSRTRGIERFTPSGVVVEGVEYELDCVVLSTGFEWGTSLDRRMTIPVIGRGGIELHEHWREGFRTFHGHSTTGFPNWFYIGRTQAAISVNYMATIESQAKNVAYVIAEAQRRGARSVETTDEGQTAWLDELRRVTVDNTAFLEECTPGYMNNEGQVGKAGGWTFDRYSPGVAAFDELTAEWRARNDLEGMRLIGADED